MPFSFMISRKPPIGTTESLETSTPGLQRLYNSTSSRVTELAAWSPAPIGREEATEAASDSAGQITNFGQSLPHRVGLRDILRLICGVLGPCPVHVPVTRPFDCKLVPAPLVHFLGANCWFWAGARLLEHPQCGVVEPVWRCSGGRFSVVCRLPESQATHPNRQ